MSGEFTDDMTLGEARDLLRKLVDEGHKCPCCTQFAKVYRRTIHAAMARDLIASYRMYGSGVFFDLTTVTGKRGTGDFTKLRYWGLVEQEEGHREDGSTRVGRWRITPAGEAWLYARTTVTKYARLYDGRCLSLVGDQVNIKDALGKKFDYTELMAGI